MGISHSTFNKSLPTNIPYLGKYIFSENPIVGIKESNKSLQDVKAMLDKDRLAVQTAKSRKVFVRSVNNIKDEKVFNSISECVTYLNTVAPSNKTTLYRHINSGKPYQGFICEYKGTTRKPLADSSVSVSITYVPTGESKTYSSFRKAALSFLPDHKISGSTLKVYSENGNLLKGKYKINVFNQIK